MNEDDAMYEFTPPDEVVKPDNPLVPVIESILSSELSGNGWRGYTKEKLEILIRDRANIFGINPESRHLRVLVRKLSKCDTIEKCLLKIEEVLF
jgi:hypothetical protein